VAKRDQRVFQFTVDFEQRISPLAFQPRLKRIQFRDHALFVAYAPADDPQIAVAVVVEHGLHGSSSAAPIARAVFESYFHVTPSRDLDNPGFLGD
jgi:hypothetical protein